MPDQQPAATENTPVVPNDADTPATAMTGIDGDHGPGGGGLGPRTGAVPAGAPGGTAPNAIVDVETPDDSGEGPEANRQAGAEAAAATAREPQPTSS